MIKSIGTCIKAKDFSRSRAFYEALGFPVTFEVGPDKEIKSESNLVIFGSETGGKFELIDAHPAIKPAVFKENIPSSKISMVFEVDSLADIIERAHTMDVAPVVGVRHYHYGSLEVVFRDPDGTVIVFVEPYTEESAKKLGASEEFGKPPSK